MTLLTLAIALAVSGVVSASAFASAVHWQKCENVGLHKGLYENDRCRSIGGNKEFKKTNYAEGVRENVRFGGVIGIKFVIKDPTIEIRCAAFKSNGGTWFENPAGGGNGIDQLTGTLENCELVGHPTCTVEPELVTAASSELSTVGAKVVDRIFGIRFRIVIRKCPQEEETELTGEDDGEVDASGELVFPSTPLESKLKIGSETATFTGALEGETESGGVIEAGDEATEAKETKEKEEVEKQEEEESWGPTILPETVKSWTGKSVGEAEMLKTGGSSVKCTSITGEGTVHASHHAGEFHLTLTGCKSNIVTCTGLADSTGVILALGSWHLAYDTLKAGLSEAGVAILLLLDTVHFTCGSTLLLVKLGGMVLCLVLSPTALTKTFEFHCNKASGATRPEETKYYNKAGTLVGISPVLAAENEGTASELISVWLGTIAYSAAVLLMI